MESGKQGGSESSSEENDGIDQQVKDTDMSSTKRSYKCSFCKRGFTNAQALGGHMNIHRKDRVKAPKQHTSGPSFSNKSDEDNIPSSFISVPVPCDPSNYNFPDFEVQKNSQMYFQPSASGSRHPQATTFRQSDLSDSRSQSWRMNQELLSANLSLRIGPMHADQEDRRKRGVNKADEVDLELRLGHDPY
ncbi:hypothetical protein I3842_02G113300 [Carya illinoinensis]|uniref:C2H2-type domain-containing protein n=1 Tax=Carya illinoinensis TaxID=32201 RepID=A0A922K0B8_CARIL|nr:hypothetical protein I3842_02G113300 [Carya illinoinensis]